MLSVDVFCCGLLTLCWTLNASHGQQIIQDQNSTATGQKQQTSSAFAAPHDAPCYVDDLFAAMRECVGDGGELEVDSLALFGVCAATDGSVLHELTRAVSGNRRNGLKLLYPTGVLVEEDSNGTLELTFDLPPSAELGLNPVLLLTLERPPTADDLNVTFTSVSLQPNSQDSCISAETHYVLLAVKPPGNDDVQQKWKISAEPRSPDMKETLKDVLIGENSRINMTPVLLLSGEPDPRPVPASSSASSQTFSFLCELKRFLCDVLPQEKTPSPPLQLDTLQSLPPLSLDLSSSESLLEGLVKSSSPTLFSFNRWNSSVPEHHGQLALSPALLAEVRQRLEQTGTQVVELIRTEHVGRRTSERLGRLKQLSALPEKEPAAGESQYRAFLLLKALQTVAQTYQQRVGQRSIRSDPATPDGTNVCGLHSLTVSLATHVVGPGTAVINNCRGSCAFPLANAINHAVLLNFHIEGGNAGERAPCCAPVAYGSLRVMEVNEDGTYLSVKPDVVATECGCR